MALFATVFSVTSAAVPTVEVTAAAIHGINLTPSALAHMRSIVFVCRCVQCGRAQFVRAAERSRQSIMS
jgi:hypothetical protein